VNNLTLITGGARSGKSRLAESIGRSSKLPIYYMATMRPTPEDAELSLRIEKHRRRRPVDWQTIEVAGDLCLAINDQAKDNALVVVDCLSCYVSRLLVDRTGSVEPLQLPNTLEEDVLSHMDSILATMQGRSGTSFIVVTNEVGLGVIPDTLLGRAFRDLLGYSNQKFAAMADTVYLMVSGLAIALKCSEDTASVHGQLTIPAGGLLHRPVALNN
jgi:adenosylcobinamide kinase / adenosylcobinamide-phosphate guanylyltransferase